MHRVYTLNKIAKCGLQALGAYTAVNENENPEGIMVRSASMHEMTVPESLLAVARAGAGTNNIPVQDYAAKGIVVFNTPGANANAVKELVLAALLMSSRKIVAGINWVQGLNGTTGVAKAVEAGKAEFVGPEITGKKLGIVGLGAIGVLVANVCEAIGMSVYGYDPFITEEAALLLNPNVKNVIDLGTIYAECDYITIHAPLNDATKKFINAETIGKMKDGVRIINLARAELVDNDAIKQGIESGRVGCYVTDFPTDDLLGVSNIITIPHLGASTPESEDNCAIMAATQLKDYLDHGNIKNSVNLPDCSLPYTGKKRLCVIHKNVPSIVANLTTELAGKRINIDNMINKSRGDFAYTIIDVDGDITAGTEEALMKIDDVIRVRVL